MMDQAEPRTLFTIGHSNHTEGHFVDLLKRQMITAVGDVRSMPYSRMNPQFNREHLKQLLRQNGIAYVFLGAELGARSDDASCYEHGKVQYDRLARTAQFQSGIQRVLQGMDKFRVALMCAEKDPLECHRTILVARHLEAAGCCIEHVLADGRTESQDLALRRLSRMLKLPDQDMFRPRSELDNEAYRQQGLRIAYEKKDWNSGVDHAAHVGK